METVLVPLTDGHGLRLTSQEDGTVHIEQTEDVNTRTPPQTIDVGYIVAGDPVAAVKSFFDSL